MTFNTCYLLLGTNLGDRSENLLKALGQIKLKIGDIISFSSIYQTKPWGKTSQPDYYNQAIKVQTKLHAKDLLKAIHHIEQLIGRVREEKWGPRCIDIDILYYNNEIIVEQDLKIPHPELHNRKFTLYPLIEIASDYIHPVFNLSTKTLLNKCIDPLDVTKIN